ncbi:hypothetical protein [Halorussus marinus]|uniref:hypothetical protein n=1 Tax=Halorussus marinus TaxID=2505976 RepID=UPI00106E3715|nr:hypothetical protein [Halorussus marinus]
MSDRTESRGRDEEAVNWTRTDGGVEIYDERNPDAWVRMEFVSGLDPGKRLYGICDDCGLVTPQRGLPADSMVCADCGAEFDAESHPSRAADPGPECDPDR